jgi:hypothetical protein
MMPEGSQAQSEILIGVGPGPLRTSRISLPRCEYPGGWLWATPRSGLPLFPGGPKVPWE